MNIYLAGSFAYREYVRKLAEKIRFYRHTVYCFCDEQELTYTLSMAVRAQHVNPTWNAKTALYDKRVQQIGLLNWTKLADTDIVIVALPCGKSAHLEAGWAKGQGKRVYVYGALTIGEWDAMYVMADGVYDESEFNIMMDAINGRVNAYPSRV